MQTGPDIPVLPVGATAGPAGRRADIPVLPVGATRAHNTMLPTLATGFWVLAQCCPHWQQGECTKPAKPCKNARKTRFRCFYATKSEVGTYLRLYSLYFRVFYAKQLQRFLVLVFLEFRFSASPVGLQIHSAMALRISRRPGWRTRAQRGPSHETGRTGSAGSPRLPAITQFCFCGCFCVCFHFCFCFCVTAVSVFISPLALAVNFILRVKITGELHRETRREVLA